MGIHLESAIVLRWEDVWAATRTARSPGWLEHSEGKNRSRSQGLVRALGRSVVAGFEQRSTMIGLHLAISWTSNWGQERTKGRPVRTPLISQVRNYLDGSKEDGEKWLDSGYTLTEGQ